MYMQCICVIACISYLPCMYGNPTSGSSSLVLRLTYVSDYCINYIYVYAQISMHNISISLYPFVVLYEVRDQVCCHFSSDCSGLSRPVALVYSTLIGLSAYYNH